MDWKLYPNFTEKEFACKHTGLCNMNPVFMEQLQKLRKIYGKPMIISSGYRHGSHPEEINKPSPGIHCYGLAADILVDRISAYQLLECAFSFCRFTGIGIQQKGANRFIHLDMRQLAPAGLFPAPALWSY